MRWLRHVALIAVLSGCSTPPSNDPELISQADSVELVSQAIAFAADSLANFRPYDRIWMARELVVRDSVYLSFSAEIAEALEESTSRLEVRRRDTEFIVCPTSGPRFGGDCDVLDDGLALMFEGLRTARDSSGVSVHLGIGEPRGRGPEGWYGFGYAIQFRWDRGRWVQVGASGTWEA